MQAPVASCPDSGSEAREQKLVGHFVRFRCMLGKEALARTLLFGAFEANKTIDISTNRMPFAVHPSQALQHLLEEWEVRWLRFAR